VVNVTPRPLYPRERQPAPVVQETLWARGPVWTAAENIALTRSRSPERQSRSYTDHLSRTYFGQLPLTKTKTFKNFWEFYSPPQSSMCLSVSLQPVLELILGNIRSTRHSLSPPCNFHFPCILPLYLTDFDQTRYDTPTLTHCKVT
jgi:hypothetical protein